MNDGDKRLAVSGVRVLSIACDIDVSDIVDRLDGLCWCEEDGFDIKKIDEESE